ncbi:hypothetical protein [Streptomyces sp. NBC_00233]|uniref:hypothetical protein n=1 Tax=Streptomyces sp. NBC_00233 TaxID=2975686 RepID=UPI002253F0C2|nr:hypothetical protein [Streptomyces sp. NBC_00233]MCX5232695.1 hypothetical protein [Streptomyces sp. NBC_00233]
MTKLPDYADGALVVAGEFDNGTVALFQRALTERRPTGPFGRSSTSRGAFADTSSLRLLMQAPHRLPRFTLAGPLSSPFHRHLELSGAAGTLTNAADVEAARPA